ncbi:type II toxin-antitoxin system HicA family toxin [Sphaerospermopsis aphanizomenoides]
MGKLRVFSGKEICKILEDNGFIEVRQKGSIPILKK